MLCFSSQAVKEIPGLSAVKFLAYVPTSNLYTLDTKPSLSVSEIQYSTEDICNTEDPLWDSTLKTFRNSNQAPSCSQGLILRSIRAGCMADTHRLDAQIIDLQKTMAELADKLTELSSRRVRNQNRADACTSFLSPVRRLPPEILGEIFLHSCPQERTPNCKRSPMQLLHICSSWRQVALGTPYLWTDFSLVTTNTLSKSTASDNLVNLAQLWLRGAKCCPISFSFEAKSESYAHCDYFRGDDFTKRVLIPYSRQYRNLQLVGHSISDFHQFLCLLGGQVDWLESLVLRLALFLNPVVKITVFEAAPRLRKLVFAIYEFEFLHRLLVPWSQLTHLSLIMAVSPAEWRMLMQLCEQLVEGGFALSSSGSTDSVDTTPFAMASLEDLRIVYLGSMCRSVFGSIELPALARFELGGAVVLPEPSLRYLELQCQGLQSLTLAGVHLSSHELLSLLRATPLLAQLKMDLELNYEYDAFVDAMARVGDEVEGGPLVPLLSELDMYVSLEAGDEAFSVERFVAMLRARQVFDALSLPIVPLEKVVLRVKCSDDLLEKRSETLCSLEEAAARGGGSGEVEFSVFVVEGIDGIELKERFDD